MSKVKNSTEKVLSKVENSTEKVLTLSLISYKTVYYQKPDGIEIDFVMRYKGECVPIECKARTGNAKSMRNVLKNPEKYHIYSAMKFGGDYNVGREGALLTMPLYMACLL